MSREQGRMESHDHQCLQNQTRHLKKKKSFPMYLFRAKSQHMEFVDSKTNSGERTFVSVMDFAENYRCQLQDEIQSAHCSYASVTLHLIYSKILHVP
ncbi:hypothetical protein PoB_006188900 [Plakobranchus ocellatus]|uniref:Uncharacterized protein n=1 Tax=Plakobranchus ocellatus TaxID=259542 RepID=A0AAV4CU31_9GAST|nr:hypothetical protein PoB_006188900 [Plakobranchus ocellatus]